MDDSQFEELTAEYPEIFGYYTGRKQPSDDDNPHPIALYGVECGDGWMPTVKSAVTAIQKQVNSRDSEPDTAITQIKEKHGELRIYTDEDTPVLRGVLQMAAIFSRSVCEGCGTTHDVAYREVDSTGVAEKTLCRSCQRTAEQDGIEYVL